MRLAQHYDVRSNAEIWTLQITRSDHVVAKLHPFARKVLDDCFGADALISDRLLGLELLARRIEESRDCVPDAGSACRLDVCRANELTSQCQEKTGRLEHSEDSREQKLLRSRSEAM